MQSIFYSWQSDLPNATNRGFIEDCLQRAIKELHAEGKVEIDPALDRDVQGVPGSPDIAETIFEKIDACSVFVGDVSFINGRNNDEPRPDCRCTRLVPNPNVLCEWGRASKSVGTDRIISVLNLATGAVEDLPFDLRKRAVTTYRLREGDDKTEERRALAGKLKSALRAILELPRAVIEIAFADRANERELGETIAIEGLFFDPMRQEDIPTYGHSGGHGFAATLASISNSQLNSNYYREKANYLLIKRLTSPVSIVARNAGDRLLRNVRLEATISRQDGDGLVFLEEHQIPDLPTRSRDFFGIHTRTAFANMATRSSPGDVDIHTFSDRYKVEVRFGDIQPKASVFSKNIYIGSRESRQIEIGVLIYADELPRPQPAVLAINVNTETVTMTMDHLETRLPEEKVAVDVETGEIVDR